MGLHNRYPSHFYKRGNLFNTYLGYSSDSGGPPAAPVSKRRQQRVRRPQSRATLPTPKPIPTPEAAAAGASLASFAKRHMSPAETDRLLRLIAASAGVPVLPPGVLDWRLPFRLGTFAAEHLAPEVTLTYLAELEERLASGQPLIQK